MTFKNLELIEPILKAIDEKGYTQPTPIQEQSIPILLEGKDLLGCAQTGTGKTAAFAIPILQNIYLERDVTKKYRTIKALIVTPTRELAIQIDESFTEYGKYTGLRNTVIFGGVKQGNQVVALRKGIDILVATPGRLLDLIGQGIISLKHVQYSVLDEADQMLDMGFIHDIRKIIGYLPKKRQSLFFSATMPPAIVDLSKKILGNPKKITIKPEQKTAEKVEQAVYFVKKQDKIQLLIHILQERGYGSTLIFSRTKHGANKIVKLLLKAKLNSEAIHGNKSQTARQKALGNFKKGKTEILVATDIAARGIDVSKLSLVVNYDLPNVSETYVHRIGRTGRAKESGLAISFCSGEERPYLRDIERLVGFKVPVIEEHPFVDDSKGEELPKDPNRQQKKPYRSRKKDTTNKSRNNNWKKRRPSGQKNNQKKKTN